MLSVMHLRTKTIILSFTTILLSTACDKQQTAPDVDTQLGLNCFQSKLPSLPPGSQYEGIKGKDGSRLTIKVMDGTGVITVECALTDDETIQKD